MNTKFKIENGIGLGLDFRDGITYDDLQREQDIYVKDQKRIARKYNSKKYPSLRLTGEYLLNKVIAGIYKLDKKEICKDLKLKMASLNMFISELNRYEGYQPFRWISVKKKRDWIEVAGNDFRNSKDWFEKNFKGLISRTSRIYQTKEKIKLSEQEKELERYKERQREKVKVTVKESKKEKNEDKD